MLSIRQRPLKNVKHPALPWRGVFSTTFLPALDKRFITGLTVVITLALIGLAVIQARWIDNTLELKRAQFDQSVDNALVAVSDRLERAELMHGLRHRQDARILLGPNDPMPVSADTLPPEVLRLDSLDDAMDARGIDAKEREALINDMVRGMLGTSDPVNIAGRIDPRLLDSLLTDELASRGINVPNEHGVFSSVGAPVLVHLGPGTDEGTLRASPHRVRLFRNDLRGEAHYLNVLIPDQQRLVWGSMRLLLIISALFTLIIVLAFVYTLRTIYRQKRISDIRTDLVNNLTHELKTPISTIALACEALTDPGMPKSPDQMNTFVGMIRDENKRLGILVESVLQSAVLDSGRMRIKPVDLDLHALLKEVERHSGIQAQRRDGRIELDLKAELAHVSGDRIHLTNVFYNLVDNAIKYTSDEPRVRIATRSDANGITVSVTDNGVGIAKADQKKIFDRLYRVPTGNVHNVKGFGLGLSYVKAVVERHGGSIRVESEPGHGSTFHVHLPFEHDHAHQAVAR